MTEKMTREEVEEKMMGGEVEEKMMGEVMEEKVTCFDCNVSVLPAEIQVHDAKYHAEGGGIMDNLFSDVEESESDEDVVELVGNENKVPTSEINESESDQDVEELV